MNRVARAVHAALGEDKAAEVALIRALQPARIEAREIQQPVGPAERDEREVVAQARGKGHGLLFMLQLFQIPGEPCMAVGIRHDLCQELAVGRQRSDGCTCHRPALRNALHEQVAGAVGAAFHQQPQITDQHKALGLAAAVFIS